MNNIQQISDNFLCSACGACNAICAREAITLKFSNIGRKYAQVDSDKCTGCGLCQKVCPSIDRLGLHKKYEDPFVGNILNTYIGHANDELIYKNAQSGGLCTAILCYLFDTGKIDGAIVCKMSFGDTPIVEGILAENKEQVIDCQKSCYTPVDVLSALKQAKDKKSLAVVGLPCHIEGAVHLADISKRFTNIKYKIGLICDRTLCAGIMDVMKSYTSANKIRIEWRKKNFTYKSKNYNYSIAPVVVTGDDNREYLMPKNYRMCLKDYFTAPRCRVCYDKLNTHADIVLGDPWGMSKYNKEKGDSVAISRTALGEDLLCQMSKDNIISLNLQRDAQEVLLGQHIDARRESVNVFSCSLKSIAKDNSVNSYVITDGKSSTLNVNILTSFVQNEKQPKEDILRKARSIVKEKNPNIWMKIMNRIKRLLK